MRDPRTVVMSGQAPHEATRTVGGAPRGLADSAPGAPRLTIRNLNFFYGGNQALKGINLDLPERQVTGMIGPSGCGKSTLLRVLNRMYDLYRVSGRPAR